LTIEIHAVPDERGGSCLFTAISSLTQFVFAKPAEEADAYAAAPFLEDLIEHAPVRLRTVETNDYKAFTDSDEKRWNPKYPLRIHPFRRACRYHYISHLVVESRDPAPKMVAKKVEGGPNAATFHGPPMTLPEGGESGA
jgi:hypothetical protein